MRNDTEQSNGPIQTFRDGAVVVKLWQQDGQNGPFVTATLGRTYKDAKSGQFKESTSLGSNDVLKAQALLIEANREMVQWRRYFREQTKAQTKQQAPGPDAWREDQAGYHLDRNEQNPMAFARDAALRDARNLEHGTPDRSAPVQDRGRSR